MCPFDYINNQSAIPAEKADETTPFDEAIAKFLTCSANYLNLPAERSSRHKPEIRKESTH